MCVCVCACEHVCDVTSDDPGPAPQINRPSVLDKCSHTSTSSFSFLSASLTLPPPLPPSLPVPDLFLLLSTSFSLFFLVKKRLFPSWIWVSGCRGGSVTFSGGKESLKIVLIWVSGWAHLQFCPSVEELNREFKGTLKETKLFIHLYYKVISRFISFTSWKGCKTKLNVPMTVWQ